MHVALVETSAIGRRILSGLLERRGHRVDAFSDARAALRFIVHNPSVDVVLTSFETDGMSGMELCWHCRLLTQEQRHIYIIAMSSGTETAKAIEALDCGADDFIRKPPVAEELFARLRAAERMSTMHRQLLWLANHDELTGLLNRRAFFEAGQKLLGESLTETPICAIMLDIDYFKRINDSRGHQAGDDSIRSVAAILSRRYSLVGRLGGEEFAVLLQGVDEFEGVKLAEHLRFEIENAIIRVGDETIRLTCSLGVGQLAVHPRETLTDLLNRADRALYQAKRLGRNRVYRFEDDVAFAIA